MSASVITASSETDEIEENISDTSYDDSLCSEGITIFECIFLHDNFFIKLINCREWHCFHVLHVRN